MFRIHLKIAELLIKIESDFEIKKIDGCEPFLINFIPQPHCDIHYVLYNLQWDIQRMISKGKILYSDSKILYCYYQGEYYRIIKIFEKYSCIKFDPLNLTYFEIFTPVEEWNYLPMLKDLLCFDLPLLAKDGVQLHSSFIKYKEQTVLFAAPSGTGKSTQAALWHQHMNSDVINGDKTILRKINDEVFAFGSPWAGTSKIYCNDFGRNPSIFIISQAKENKIAPLSNKSAVALLLSEVQAQCWRIDATEKICVLLEWIVARCNVNILECRPDISAVTIVHEFLLNHNH